jgi:hypothetical protein
MSTAARAGWHALTGPHLRLRVDGSHLSSVPREIDDGARLVGFAVRLGQLQAPSAPEQLPDALRWVSAREGTRRRGGGGSELGGYLHDFRLSGVRVLRLQHRSFLLACAQPTLGHAPSLLREAAAAACAQKRMYAFRGRFGAGGTAGDDAAAAARPSGAGGGTSSAAKPCASCSTSNVMQRSCGAARAGLVRRARALPVQATHGHPALLISDDPGVLVKHPWYGVGVGDSPFLPGGWQVRVRVQPADKGQCLPHSREHRSLLLDHDAARSGTLGRAFRCSTLTVGVSTPMQRSVSKGKPPSSRDHTRPARDPMFLAGEEFLDDPAPSTAQSSAVRPLDCGC